MKNNLMLDLETLGVRNSSVFLSFAAVMFDIETGETGDEFYTAIKLDSALEAGLTVDASTIEWWMKQDLGPRAKMFEETIPLKNSLIAFEGFMERQSIGHERPPKIKVWGNSASFDCGILKNGYNALNLTPSWDFRYERCYRTIIGEFPEIGKDIERVGVHHNPLDDCYYQIKKLCEVWKHINFNINESYRNTEFVSNYEQALLLIAETIDDPECSVVRLKKFLEGSPKLPIMKAKELTEKEIVSALMEMDINNTPKELAYRAIAARVLDIIAKK